MKGVAIGTIIAWASGIRNEAMGKRSRGKISNYLSAKVDEVIPTIRLRRRGGNSLSILVIKEIER